ncbi:hypothetical protein [Allorhizocola rhizosphaerae]|uniref:hypothetical protein n=1 Tax=Allorhizocola rhizosphaerae TaxID=1872709 RepID=UPI001FE711DD|nr:hypothetical protein [Allorhizocola rhizosphaerae]
MVGHIASGRNRIGYVWYPDGTSRALPTPVVDGEPAIDFDARRARNGWVTGFVMPAKGSFVGVRWDLVTGEVMVLDQVGWSHGVSADGWIVGMDRQDDAVLTDGMRILKLQTKECLRAARPAKGCALVGRALPVPTL